MPDPESRTKAKPTRDPQALSAEYHKARKQLMLWAGILFVWELVGIDLEKAKEAGGNAGAILTAIKSPQAIPWVLVVLVAYFVFKLGIEWNQCEARRRENVASRIDVGSAWVVAFLACALYAYQAISRIQIADVVQTSGEFKSSAMGAGAGGTLGMALAVWFSKGPLKPSKFLMSYALALFVLSLLMLLFPMFRGGINMKYMLGGTVLTSITTGLFFYAILRNRVSLPIKRE